MSAHARHLAIIAIAFVHCGCARLDSLTLAQWLSKPNATASLTLTDRRPGGATRLDLELAGSERCLTLEEKGATAQVDGSAATLEPGRSWGGTFFEKGVCFWPQLEANGLPELMAGQSRTLTLKDSTATVTVSVRARSDPATIATPAPFPGEGQRWHVEWGGLLPSKVFSFGREVAVTSADGGFDVVVPEGRLKPAEPALWMIASRFQITDCPVRTCTVGGGHHVMFDLDGGVVLRRRDDL